MKKFLSIAMIALAVSLSGCAAIQKQANLNAQMENLVMNAPADKVYNAAVNTMNSMFVRIRTTGRNQGASSWQIKPVSLGTKHYKEKTRFTVKVTAKGKNKSVLIISKERSSNMMGDWNRPLPGRLMSYEYQVLKKINPARAAEIDKNATVKAI